MISKKHLLLLLPLSILLSACGPVQAPAGTPSASNTPATEQNLNTSMRDLMGMGKSLQCKYSYTDTETKFETKGVMYLSGTKFAQETEMIVPKESSVVSGKMHMISDGVNVYTWNPDKKDSGMKIAIEKNDQNQPQEDTAESGSVDLDKKMDMNCSPWNADDSKFKVPNDVNFIDLSQMMKGLPSGIPTMPKNIPNIPQQ